MCASDAPGQLLLLFAPAGLFRLAAGNAGQQGVKGVSSSHFFLATLVAAIFVFAVAGAATSPQHLFPDQRDYRVVRRAFATGAVIVNVVTKSHDRTSETNGKANFRLPETRIWRQPLSENGPAKSAL
jgi:hypothetical protein